MVIIKMKIEQYASIILIVVGFYYIIAELIAIVSSKSGVKAYLYNTISELGTNSFSPQFKLMNSAFFLTGITFGACYALVIYPELTGLYRFICLILASSLSIGTLVVGMFHGGEYLFHNIGTVMTFVGGSLLLIPLACSLFGISNDIAMQVVGVGFIIVVIQDSCETALNSSTDVLFTATADIAAKRKANK